MENSWAQWLVRGTAVIAGLIKAGQDAIPTATLLANSIRAGGSEPSETEWGALKQAEGTLRERLHRPLPPGS